jgi:hypothetical protein
MINNMTEKNLPSDYYGESPDPMKTPSPNPEDVSSIENIVRASYETISGPPGQKRDWKRMHSLCLPEAHSIRTGPVGEGRIGYKLMETDEFAMQMNDWLTQNGFFEREIHRVVEQFGSIAHVFSTYESRRNLDDAEPYMRGINSIQLFHDGTRWWIVNVMWRHESPELPIPEKYLP